MEWLKILALTMSIADGAYTCNVINSVKGIENNKFMPKTCKGILIRKTAFIVPMFIIRKGKYRNTFIGINMIGGGVGLSVSIYNMNKKKP